jgi:DNA-directed RNA polymerase subunit alpha
MSEVSADLATFFETADVNFETVESFADKVHESTKSWNAFDSLVREQAAGQADALHLGLADYILGRYQDARAQLAKAGDSGLKYWYDGHAALALAAYDDAVAAFSAAAKQGWDRLTTDMQCVVAHIRANQVDPAIKLIEQHQTDGDQRADWHFARGLVAEHGGDRAGALRHFEQALTIDPDHEAAMFRSAWLYDMQADDEQAIELYERLTEKPRAKVNALMNLAVICEDQERFGEAIRCLRRVLRIHPNHARARLFLKDVESSRQMVIDDAIDDHGDARSRLMDAPIGEFELSVRARNCLKKMNIHTLGQLVQLSEPELLAYKNFGEASLNEIKQLLARKNMRLGQRPEEIDPEQVAAEEHAPPMPELPPGQEAVLNKSISDLELSVRSRRCLQRLNVNTLGELLQYSEADLMAARNFGVTSLNEIKGRLAEHGLSLPTKRAE